MKLLLAGAAMLTALASPAVARTTTTPVTSPSTQSVYRTVATSELRNSDGTISEITVTTVYSIFGYE